MTDFVARYVTLPQPLDAYDDVYYQVTGLLSQPGVPDWLASHVVDICDEYAALAEGSSVAAPDRGSDPVVAFVEAGRRARHAFRREDYLETPELTPIGIMPGSVVVQHVVNELTSHAWDIANAVGADLHLPDELFDQVRDSWQVFFETYGRADANFEPEKDVPTDASAAARLAAYLGRTVQ